MRTLERNKTELWLVEKTGSTDVKDSDNNYTGETEATYSDPVSVKLALYPSVGKVAEQIFGKDAQLDLIALSSDVVLTPDSLLFLSSPSESADYSTTYDYRVDTILKSINNYNYGLRRRT